MLRSRRWLLVLALVAFVSARVAGAHLHLCLDGSEPPSAVHAMDGGFEHHPEEPGSHEDLDVDPLQNALAKAAKLDLPVLGPAPSSLLTVVPQSRWQPVRTLEVAAPAGPVRFLIPPSRGPPAAFSVSIV